MKAGLAIGAAAAALAVQGAARADSQALWLDLGLLRNNGPGGYVYEGAYAAHVSGTADPLGGTLLKIDLGAILATIGAESFTAIAVTDSGRNAYGGLSPGADIDFLALKNVTPGLDLAFTYAGPNTLHLGESPAVLAARLAELDSLSGDQDAWDLTHVSLGDRGMLRALLGEPEPIDAPHVPGRPKLLLREAGSMETFHVAVKAVVPSAGTLATLGVAALVLGRRRRKRGISHHGESHQPSAIRRSDQRSAISDQEESSGV